MHAPDARRPARRPLPRLLLVTLLVLVAAVAVVAGARLLAPSIAGSAVRLLAGRVVVTATVRPMAPAPDARAAAGVDPSARPATPPRAHRARRPIDGVGEADGVVPAGTSVDDATTPGVTRLDPALLAALRRANDDAADDGVTLLVDSGWRSPRYQEQLLRDAIARYGSEAAAARWVATAETSPHVAGKAADIGPPEAAAWLSAHGARYGLCQVFRNEPWHYELRRHAAERGCPRMFADPTRDPRMQP